MRSGTAEDRAGYTPIWNERSESRRTSLWAILVIGTSGASLIIEGYKYRLLENYQSESSIEIYILQYYIFKGGVSREGFKKKSSVFLRVTWQNFYLKTIGYFQYPKLVFYIKLFKLSYYFYNSYFATTYLLREWRTIWVLRWVIGCFISYFKIL